MRSASHPSATEPSVAPGPARALAAPAQPTPATRHPLSDAEFAAIAIRNLEVAMSLRATAWELSAAGLRAFRPELDEQDVQAEVRRLFLVSNG